MDILYTAAGVLLVFMGQGIVISTIDRAPRRAWFAGIPIGLGLAAVGVVCIQYAVTL